MALDSRDRRAAAIAPGLPWRGLLPAPDGSLDEGDRSQAVGLFRFGVVGITVGFSPPRAVSLSICCPADATLPPSMLPPPPRGASFAAAPTVDAAAVAPPPLQPAALSSRARIRGAVRAVLMNHTAAGDRVYLNRSEAWSRDEFPAIGLYYAPDRGQIANDAERQYLRTLELGVEVIVARRLGFEVGSNAVGDAIAFSESDELDDLCDQVERSLLADVSLGGIAADLLLIRTDMDFDARGERVLGAARIVFNLSYFEPVVERSVLLARDFRTLHAEWKVPAPQSTPTASDDIQLPLS